MPVAVALLSGLSMVGCAATPSIATSGVAATSDRVAEPTTTYLPSPAAVPLFTLLAIRGDYQAYRDIAQLTAATRPRAVVVGRITSVVLGAAREYDLQALPGEMQRYVFLKVAPSALAGIAQPEADGLIYVEVYLPALVSEQSLTMAYGYDREAVFLLTDQRRGTRSLVDETPLPRHGYSLVHPQAVLYPDDAGQLRPAMAPDAPGLTDLQGVNARQAGEMFARAAGVAPAR